MFSPQQMKKLIGDNTNKGEGLSKALLVQYQ
jgi:hypothetical protein